MYVRQQNQVWKNNNNDNKNNNNRKRGKKKMKKEDYLYASPSVVCIESGQHCYLSVLTL